MPLDVKGLFRDLPTDETVALGELINRVDLQLSDDIGSTDWKIGLDIIEEFVKGCAFDFEVTIAPNRGYKEDFDDLKLKYIRLLEKNREASLRVEAADEIRDWRESSGTFEFGFARFSEDERAKIIDHIDKIRIIISSSPISERKKTKLLDILTELYNETLQDKTKTERFFAFMGDVALTVGEMAEKAKPAIEQTKEILRIVMRSRARNEGAVLPPADDLPQLPSS